ncbi:hypothetical protein L228DRAFT_258465 [Xylona heveae TC161]|uniref:Uncharacterized protein n=1 Tax=Xylona heveae (strain CBS 132557 / TC161) TaxID=1328760 RepID=A0A165IJD2_XYLHT|nr:hypothetical protein L228DRAFT_258465 [Xylona heveae TC161]KZF24976.1 hypothetical protein L228DRAFT_258465 [Xylona heveae TC161]
MTTRKPITNEAAKVAYLFKATAIELYSHECNIDFLREEAQTRGTDILFLIQQVCDSNPSQGMSLYELAQYEKLYYGICSKIRRTVGEIFDRLNKGLIEMETILHQRGIGCDSERSPLRVKNFLDLLETHWGILNDSGLVSILHAAVKEKNIQIAIEQRLKTTLLSSQNPEDHKTQDRDLLRSQLEQRRHEIRQKLNKMPGLRDFSNVPASDLFADLRVGYDQEIERERKIHASGIKDRQIERARIHHQRALDILCGKEVKRSISLASSESRDNLDGNDEPKCLNLSCTCKPDCLCAPLCADYPENDCACKTIPLFAEIREQIAVESSLGDIAGHPHLLGARSEKSAQLQVAALALPEVSEFEAAVKLVEDSLAEMELTDYARAVQSRSKMDGLNTVSSVASRIRFEPSQTARKTHQSERMDRFCQRHKYNPSLSTIESENASSADQPRPMVLRAEPKNKRQPRTLLESPDIIEKEKDSNIRVHFGELFLECGNKNATPGENRKAM